MKLPTSRGGRTAAIVAFVAILIAGISYDKYRRTTEVSDAVHDLAISAKAGDVASALEAQKTLLAKIDRQPTFFAAKVPLSRSDIQMFVGNAYASAGDNLVAILKDTKHGVARNAKDSLLNISATARKYYSLSTSPDKSKVYDLNDLARTNLKAQALSIQPRPEQHSASESAAIKGIRKSVGTKPRFASNKTLRRHSKPVTRTVAAGKSRTSKSNPTRAVRPQ